MLQRDKSNNCVNLSKKVKKKRVESGYVSHFGLRWYVYESKGKTPKTPKNKG